MAILNKDSFFKIHTSLVSPETYIGSEHWHFPIIEKRNESFMFLIWDDTDNKDYWFIDVFSGTSFDCYPIETIVPENILRKIWNKEIYLLISNTHEGYHNVVGGIYKDLIIRAHIPEEQIILISESADILKEVEAVSNHYGKKHIKVEWLRIFEANTKIWLSDPSINLPTTLEDKQYNKKFLCFNNHMHTHGRLHRGSLIALMCSMNMLDYGYVSAGMYEEYPTWSDIFGELKVLHKDNHEIMTMLKENEQKILNIGKLIIDADYEILKNRDNAYIQSSINNFYANTYFSVVTETNCLSRGISFGEYVPPGRQLSEKTFKPIGYKHPFILVSPAHTLSLLKEIGYKTFSPWIDESYDNETDESARLLMIVKEIKRLSALSPAALSEFLNNARDICEYNYQVLLSKTVYNTRLNY
jgi:hypothetical protein